MKKLCSLLTLSALAACGGGNAVSQNAMPPGSPLQNVAVQFSITIPKSIDRVPQYISTATQSAVITVTPSGGAALTPVTINCTTTCQGTVQAPVGADTFAVSLFSQQNGAGTSLSTGSTSQTILAGVPNTVTMTFGGVVAKIVITLGVTSVTGAGSTPVTVTAKDAANQTIVGTANYSNPITLSDTDTSAGTSLSTTAVVSPATAVSLSYTSSFTSALIGATAPGVLPTNVSTATLTKATSIAAAFMAQTSATKTSASCGWCARAAS